MAEFGGHPFYSCRNCLNPLAFQDDLLSKAFKLIEQWKEHLQPAKEKMPIRLDNLEILDLSDNKLNNSILSSAAAFTSLRELYLDDNGLEGIIDVTGN
ncbi:hypothetical protein JRO89_XS15G0042000 [Xanthoceras sorbifolium]|uniref:Uncharacterized protein n=1 Tax=Xanthoceras sorbifolium TaxID=99658 RepID=A0ABQ8H117_9ROSI|nr:hypothetical protein JRO89_XS15G0042000 [Xanthoceras sorbifolium]